MRVARKMQIPRCLLCYSRGLQLAPPPPCTRVPSSLRGFVGWVKRLLMRGVVKKPRRCPRCCITTTRHLNRGIVGRSCPLLSFVAPCSFLRCIPICFGNLSSFQDDVVGAVSALVVNCAPGLRVPILVVASSILNVDETNLLFIYGR